MGSTFKNQAAQEVLLCILLVILRSRSTVDLMRKEDTQRQAPVGSAHGALARPVKYKVVQIWPGLIVCKRVTVCPGHIWTALYIPRIDARLISAGLLSSLLQHTFLYSTPVVRSQECQKWQHVKSFACNKRLDFDNIRRGGETKSENSSRHWTGSLERSHPHSRLICMATVQSYDRLRHTAIFGQVCISTPSPKHVTIFASPGIDSSGCHCVRSTKNR